MKRERVVLRKKLRIFFVVSYNYRIDKFFNDFR